jgi:tRNA threonylcarbamoyladenosine biosynthesis protein TsaB
MTLFIDTINFSAVTYTLVGEKTFKKTFLANPHESHEVFGHLEKFLKQSSVFAKATADKKISKIVVNKGPGSYTGTRIGVTHALALGFAWNVPVKTLDNEKFSLLLNGKQKR